MTPPSCAVMYGKVHGNQCCTKCWNFKLCSLVWIKARLWALWSESNNYLFCWHKFLISTIFPSLNRRWPMMDGCHSQQCTWWHREPSKKYLSPRTIFSFTGFHYGVLPWPWATVCGMSVKLMWDEIELRVRGLGLGGWGLFMLKHQSAVLSNHSQASVMF